MGEVRRSADAGFTLVELLVVVVILGVLAAVAVPSYLEQRRRAWADAAKSDLRNAVVAMEQLVLDGGTYLSADLSALNRSPGVSFSFGSVTAETYCLQVDHRGTTPAVDFHFDSAEARPEPGPC